MNWIKTSDEEIPINKRVVAGLWVYNTNGDKYFEFYSIWIDKNECVRDGNGDYLSAWDAPDFEYWFVPITP